MRIIGLEVDGFGVWSGLRLSGLAEGLNLLYGPNEAGKTTLLEFVRSMLYGFSPPRRRYLPPLRGGRPGGSIHLAGATGGGAGGRFQLARHRNDHDAGTASGDTRQQGQEELALTAADGTRQGEHLIKGLLCDVDEATYNNVFAVGLREIQELGTLSDTQAADLLYRLTAGLDRVSLVDVMRELQTSRNRILDAGGGPSQVVELLAQREKLRLKIEELGKATRHYERLAAERTQVEREVNRLEEDNNRTELQARVVELAIGLRERWQRRAELDDQLATLAPAAALPDGALERLDAINAGTQKHRQLAAELLDRRRQLREEAADLKINQSLWRQGPYLEALRQQESWIGTLQNHVAQLQTEIAELESSLAAQWEQLGLGRQSEPGPLPSISADALARLRPPAKAIRQSRGRLREAKQAAATADQAAQSLAQQVEAGLAARGQTDLAAASDRAGNLVSQLRRRLQIDQRLDEMSRFQKDVEEQSRRLVDRQLLPVWVLAALGGVFVIGVVLVMAGLFMPKSAVGSMGWAMALLGLGGSGMAGLGKVMLERSNARRLESCQKQTSMLQSQIQQAKEDGNALDSQLPGGAGSIAGRLEAAEKELAALEELVSLDTRRSAAQQEAQAAAGRVDLAQEKLAADRRRWREALAAAGLPDNLAPQQVRQLIKHCDQLGELHRRLGHRREELTQRRSELDLLLGRITQLAADANVAVTGEPAEQLRQLGEALSQQQALIERRNAIGRQARLLRRRQAKHDAALGRLRRRRRELLREADAGDEQEFRQRALQAARANVLRQQREALTREITAAIAGQCPEEAVREQLKTASAAELQTRRDELLDRLGTLETELQKRFEKRGRLAEQLKTLAEDREMATRQLELATVEKRLQDAISRWQVLAVTSHTLEEIRTAYERDRQPETLQEASAYLSRLTRGRYQRVWTPLGEDVLRVDDAEGHCRAVEALSRGTREQLFLALRLALAGTYARRGAPLPLILDDVLVNFDAERAKAAAAVLRDFAAAGHQLLVFTCHEHILKLFQSLKVPLARLPDAAEASHAPITLAQPAKPKRQQQKKTRQPQPAAAQQAPHEPPTDEIAAIDDPEADHVILTDELPDEEVLAPPDDLEDEDEHGQEDEDDTYQWEDLYDEQDEEEDDEGYHHEEDGTAEAA